MKNFKFTLVLVLMMVLPATKAFSQIDISTNPLSALFGFYGLSGEYVLNENVGISVGGNYSDREVFDIDYSGFSSEAMFKYYFNPDSREGADKFYVGGYLEYGSLSANGTSDEIKVTSLNLGMAVGYKTISDGGLFFEAAFGLGRSLANSYELNGESDDDFDDASEYLPVVYGKLALGYRIK